MSYTKCHYSDFSSSCLKPESYGSLKGKTKCLSREKNFTGYFDALLFLKENKWLWS